MTNYASIYLECTDSINLFFWKCIFSFCLEWCISLKIHLFFLLGKIYLAENILKIYIFVLLGKIYLAENLLEMYIFLLLEKKFLDENILKMYLFLYAWTEFIPESMNYLIWIKVFTSKIALKTFYTQFSILNISAWKKIVLYKIWTPGS